MTHTRLHFSSIVCPWAFHHLRPIFKSTSVADNEGMANEVIRGCIVLP